MPVIIPTPDELARMSWSDRQKAARIARGVLNALRPNPEPMFTPAYTDPSAETWAEQTRAEATRMLALLPTDPDAPAHRKELVTQWA